MKIFVSVLFAFSLLCGSWVSGFSQGSLPLNKASIPRASACRYAALNFGIARKTALTVTARFQTDVIDRRSLLIGTIFSVVSSFNKKALAADSEDQFTAALLELSNQAPYEDKAVAFLSDGSPSFALAEAALTKLGGTVVSINPKKPVSEIQKLYKDGNCIGAFVTDEKILKNIMQGRGCECERCYSMLLMSCSSYFDFLLPAVVMPESARAIAGVASEAAKPGRAGLSSSARRARTDSKLRYLSPWMFPPISLPWFAVHT